MKLLALGAHPDDVEIYMFGTLLAAKARGDDVTVAIATDGSKGGKGEAAALRDTRRRETTAGLGPLGVKPHFLDVVDGELVAEARVIAAIKELIAAEQPDLILTHAPNDYHGDHRALSDAVRIASSFSAPVAWADNLQGVGLTPTHYVDITAHFEAKAAAIRAHASQDPERLVALAESLNAFRASQSNQPPGSYAEAFRFEPQFPFVDIRDLFPPAPPVGAVRDRCSAED
jgi:N-acetylglucosamine malate deacetylase 1